MSAPPSEVVRYFWEDARTQQWGELLSQKFCGNVEGLEGGLGGGDGKTAEGWYLGSIYCTLDDDILRLSLGYVF